jgi:DNA polymerase I
VNYDPLIYGKNDLERIVSIEVKDDTIEVFCESPEGLVYTEQLPNTFWILAEDKLDKDFERLEGDLAFKWGKLYNSRSRFMADRYNYKSHGVYSIYNHKEAAMLKDGLTYFKGMKHNEVSCLSFDIESTSLEKDDSAHVLLISNTFRRNGQTGRKLFSYENYADEGEMLKAWADWVRDEIDPSIMLGHNIFSYDLPYMAYVADRHGVELNLGRDGSCLTFDTYESKFRKDANQFYHYFKSHVYGRELVDTMFLAIKYDAVLRKYESYGLKQIIKQEGLEIDNRPFYDASKIRFNYKDPVEWEKIKAYAEQDGDDALALYDLMAPPFFYITQSVPKPYQLVLESASGSQINSVMVRSYLQEGHSIPKASEAIPYEGAISFGNPGIYENVYKIDVASLYPSIMIECQVYDAEKDPKGYFLSLVKTFTERRLEHKKLAKGDKYYDDLQNAEKIFINSCYGFLGTNGLNFNQPDGAAFVTETGRKILQTAIDWATGLGFQIVNADTDSISFSKSLGGEFTESERRELLDAVNGLYPPRIHFEDDGYYKKIIVTKAKNYILYDGKKVKTKGSALKATTKEPALKQFIQDVIDQILKDHTKIDAFVAIYDFYVHEIQQISDIKRWATRKTITQAVLNPKRTNESKILDALVGVEYSEGDRFHFYFKADGSLGLAEKFDGDYDRDTLLAKLYNTAQVFEQVLDCTIFPNYKLKRNKEALGVKYENRG